MHNLVAPYRRYIINAKVAVPHRKNYVAGYDAPFALRKQGEMELVEEKELSWSVIAEQYYN